MYFKTKINAIQAKYTLINREHHLQLFRWEEGKDETSRECISQYEVTHSSWFRVSPLPLQLQNKNTGEMLAGVKLMPKCPVTSAESGFHARYFKVQLYQADILDHQWEWVHISPQVPTVHTLQTPTHSNSLDSNQPF